GLASAALGEGVHTIRASSRRVQDAPYQDWWYDEYAVDLATGQSSQAIQHTGWLGSPLGPAVTQLWPNPEPDVITNTGFEIDVAPVPGRAGALHVQADDAIVLRRHRGRRRVVRRRALPDRRVERVAARLPERHRAPEPDRVHTRRAARAPVPPHPRRAHDEHQ